MISLNRFVVTHCHFFPECRHRVSETDTSNGRLFCDGRLSGPLRSGNLSALDDPDQKCDDGQDQQDMDEPAQSVGSNEAQEPQDEQYRKDRPKHIDLLYSSMRVLKARRLD